jgi:SAM-dependent methyltransferase
LGAGFAALIAGAERYIALDESQYSDSDQHLRVFDELVDLFRRRASFQGVEFPAHILTDQRLARALDERRVAGLRETVRSGRFADGTITYIAPCFSAAQVQPGTIDWIFSHAVLEHVDDLSFVYRACDRWLAPGGVMSHQIDFRSHGTAPSWDGHRGYSDLTWRLIRGARSHLINREPLSRHRDIPRNIGFDLISQLVTTEVPALGRPHLAFRFREWSEEDLCASSALLVHRKPIPSGQAEQGLRRT